MSPPFAVTTFLLALLAGTGALAQSYGGKFDKVENLVSFGDSYTDEGRLAAYVANKGSAPPPGTSTAGSNSTASGGYAWGHFAVQELNAKYFDYAVSGAFCSNAIFSRWLAGINRTFPAILEDQIPSFVADTRYVNRSTGTNTYFTNRLPGNTVYALWIGTNDLGIDAFLTDSQGPGLTITNFVECIWQTFDIIYKTGGRRFVLLNVAPLELTPLYAAPQNHGVGNDRYWPKKESYNMTAYEQKMKEYSTNVNTMFDYGVPFHQVVKQRWKGASVAVFNVHQLLTDMYREPSRYLDSPANSTGFYRHCSVNGTNCVNSEQPRSSFLWYDSLHPSAKTDEVIGKEFSKVVRGASKYGTYW